MADETFKAGKGVAHNDHKDVAKTMSLLQAEGAEMLEGKVALVTGD